MMWRQMKKDGRLVEAIDVTATVSGHAAEQLEGVVDGGGFQKLQPGPIVIHLNPPEFETLYFKLPIKLRRRSRIIAYWAWELEIMPKAWRRAARLCDEIWVPSEFVAEAVRRLLGSEAVQQVQVVPHPFDGGEQKPQDPWVKMATRARYGFSNDEFIAGYSFAFSSNFARKNPLAAIRAFQKAFPAHIYISAKLLLRYRDGNIWPHGITMLKTEAENDNRILLFDEIEAKINIEHFYDLLDVYISLHRSEGYGLTLMEAANRGIRVITTGWWLANDISNHPKVASVGWSLIPVEDPQMIYNVPGAYWAEPDIDDAANKLYAISVIAHVPMAACVTVGLPGRLH